MSLRQTSLYRAARRAALAALSVRFRLLGALRAPRVVVYHGFTDFGRKAQALASLLRAHGFDVSVRDGQSSIVLTEASHSRDLWIGYWNDYPLDRLPANYIFCNGEPLAVDRWGKDPAWIGAMRGARDVWDYSETNLPILERLAIPHRYVPFGYAPDYEESFRRHTTGKALTTDIDVLFVGSMSERRRRILDALRAHGVAVHEVTRENPAHGARLDELVARSRMVLGIHFHTEPLAQVADLARLDQLLANRVFVVQEQPAPGAATPDFLRHVVTRPYDELVAACLHFLAAPDERRERAEAAYAWFAGEMHLSRYIPFDLLRRLLAQS